MFGRSTPSLADSNPRFGLARIAAAIPILLWALSLQVAAAEAAKSAPPSSIGFRILDIPRQEGDKDPPPMTAALWYPTQAAPACYTYNDTYKTTNTVALDSPPAPGAHPLVIFSHGYGGAGISSPYLTEFLASQGFIVAAPDHEDHNYLLRTKRGSALKESWFSFNVINLARSGKHFDHKAQAHRCKDVTQLINVLLEMNKTDGSPLKGAINPDAIGIMGHSLGGYTALRVCGVGGPECGPSEKDPRIKAALLLTGGVFMFRVGDYREFHVPVMMMFGEVETSRWRAMFLNDKVADTRRAYDNCAPPKYMIEIKGGNHFSFCQAIFDKKWPGVGPEKAAPVVEAIKTYSLAFLRRWLLNDQGAEQVLSRKDPLFRLYEKREGQD